MTPAQTRALAWVLESSIHDFDSYRRELLSPGDRQEEWDDLRELCGLLPDADRDRLLALLGEHP